MIHKGDPLCPGGQVGGPAEDRECLGNQGQTCPADDTPLECLDDYVGGGSHYWTLFCWKCDTRYTYDTYRFQLEAWPWARGGEP